MIGAVVLLRDVHPNRWWPAKIWVEDQNDLVPAAKITAIALREAYGDLLRDPGWERPLLEGGSPGEGD